MNHEMQVPEGDYTIPLGQAEVMRPGTDVTLVGWGGQLRVLEKVGPIRHCCLWEKAISQGSISSFFPRIHPDHAIIEE
jgi:hypothetical protein